jgi:uroporphyrinogen decarboxylase
MNSKERLDRYLKGERVDRRPNLTIVGSVVTRYTNISIPEYCKDYRKMTESAIKAAHDLKLDFVQIASDLLREAEGYGSKVSYSVDNLPNVEKYAVDKVEDIAKLKLVKPQDVPRMYDLVEATTLAISQEKDVYPFTLIVGPVTIASNICDAKNFMTFLVKEPEAVADLLELTTGTVVEMVKNLSEVGSKHINIADPVASLVSPRHYSKFFLPLHQRVFEEMNSRQICSRLHMCGNTTRILPHAVESGAVIVDIDHQVDYAQAYEMVGERVLLNGNIDPAADVLLCDPVHTKHAVLDRAKQINFARALFMPGCELPPQTPLENARAIHEALVEIGA